MEAYNYGDYFYFKNMTDIPNEHHNHFISNQIQSMYMTPKLKYTCEIFEFLPNLFVDKCLKMDECPHTNCG